MRKLAIALTILAGVLLAQTGCTHMQDNGFTTHDGSGGGGAGGGGGM